MKAIAAAVIVWLLAPLSVCVAQTKNAGVDFSPATFEVAAQNASAAHKIVFVDFYTTWCAPCKRLDATTWKEAAVAKLIAQHAVALRLDAEKEGKALATKYSVDAYPTLLLLKPDGTEIDRLVGYREPTVFLQEFQDAIDGKSAAKHEAAVAAKAAHRQQVDQVRQRLFAARDYANQHTPAETLQELLWLFDEGTKGLREFSGIRVSFLTGQLGLLAKTFPPAADAVRVRRDAALGRMLLDAKDNDAPSEFAALSDALGEKAAILREFDKLPANDRRRGSLGIYIFDDLVAERKYQDALQARPFDVMVLAINHDIPVPANAADVVKAGIRKSQIELTVTNIEALLGAGDTAHARELRDRLLKKFDGDDVKAALREHIQRVGGPDAESLLN
jgi:thiol-disulfide isomerase/thioredoxin